MSVEQHALKLVPSTDYRAHQEYDNSLKKNSRKNGLTLISLVLKKWP